MKTPTSLITPILLFVFGACSSDPEDPSASANDKRGSAQTASATSGSTSDETAPPINLDGTGGPLAMPGAEIHELNQTSFTVTWGNPDNWLEDKLTGPAFKLELSTKAKFDEILFSREYLGENNASFVNLAPATAHFLRLTAMSPKGDDRYLPSRSNVIAFSTYSDTTGVPGGIVITPEFGAVTIEWPPVKASGIIEYYIQIYEDLESGVLAKQLIIRETAIKSLPLPCEKTYWLRFRHGPAVDNEKDIASLPFVTQFQVPGNQLDSPENLVASIVGKEVKLSWKPVANNLGPIEYLLNVYIGETLTNLYGNFLIDKPFRVLEDSKAYGIFNFELYAIPKEGNTKDIKSELASLLFDMPTFSFDPPRAPALALSPDDPSMLAATWQAPENANGALRYEMEIADDGNFSLDSSLDQRIESADVT
ncbi:MAG: hypothetical protein VB997_01180, partial [Opitutales bacterium]